MKILKIGEEKGYANVIKVGDSFCITKYTDENTPKIQTMYNEQKPAVESKIEIPKDVHSTPTISDFVKEQCKKVGYL